MSERDPRRLLQEVAEKHGAVLDRDDPLLMACTAMLHIIDETTASVSKGQQEALQAHQQQLELIIARAQQAAAAAGSQIVTGHRRAAATAMEAALANVFTPSCNRLQLALAKQQRAATRTAVACWAAAAVAAASTAISLAGTL